MGRRTVPRTGTKRALVQAGTPIYDSVMVDLNFDPSAEWIEPVAKTTPKTVAKRVSRKTPANPKVTA